MSENYFHIYDYNDHDDIQCSSLPYHEAANAPSNICLMDNPTELDKGISYIVGPSSFEFFHFPLI